MAERREGSRLRVVLGLAGLLLLAVPGFAVGLLAGVVWREPGLVATHLAGGTREVAWGSPDASGSGEAPPPAETGDVAAPPPAAPPPPGTPAPKAAPAPAAKPAPTAAAREPAPIAAIDAEATPRLAVQVGAFGDAASAEKLAGTLRRKGFPAFVSPSTGASGARWRVRVGPMTSRDDADRTAARLKSEERLPTWVIEEGRS
jgi:cell division septation protein DedD